MKLIHFQAGVWIYHSESWLTIKLPLRLMEGRVNGGAS
jgi:hypothetical protein